MNRFAHCVIRINGVLFAVSTALLGALMFLTAADVAGRFFGHPIRGAYQISEIVQVAIICLAWPVTTREGIHIRLDLLWRRFPAAVQKLLEITTHLISLFVFVVIAWQGLKVTRRALDMGELLAIVDIPLFPFLVVIPLGAFFNCLVLILRMGELLRSAEQGGVS